MAPFSMKCTTCGEFIYKGRKFNARKETNQDEKYRGNQIFHFHIKCTRCSAPIIFRTDPKNSDYAMVKGALRNAEPWRNKETAAETDEERLDRLEREEAEEAGEEETNAMADLEAKNADARREMAAADALDEIRYRNARINRNEKDGMDYADTIVRSEDEERERQEREDEEVARRAFAAARAPTTASNPAPDDHEATKETTPNESSVSQVGDDGFVKPALPASALAAKEQEAAVSNGATPAPTFKRVVKKKKDHSALLGIKKKAV